MRKIAVIAALASLVFSLALPLSASQMRGLWVDAWHKGYCTPEQTSAMVAKAKECGFNTLFVQVRKRGNVFYRSRIEPMSKDVAPDYDPLADVIAKAHEAGLQVHAWLIAFQVYPDNAWDMPNAPDKVHILHPEWVMKNSKGVTRFSEDAMYLDPGVPEVRAYLLSLVEELAKNYEIDGIHYDRVGYPRRDAGYSEAGVAQFNKETKHEGTPAPDDKSWCEWRISQVNHLIRSTGEAAKRFRPKVQISASVPSNPRDARWNRLQDWPAWLEQGIMDFAVPMLFLKESKTLSVLLPDLISAGKGKPVYIGLGAWQLTSAQALEQVKAVMDAGAKGVVIYNYALCTEPGSANETPFMDAVKVKYFAEPSEAPGPASKSWCTTDGKEPER